MVSSSYWALSADHTERKAKTIFFSFIIIISPYEQQVNSGQGQVNIAGGPIPIYVTGPDWLCQFNNCR